MRAFLLLAVLAAPVSSVAQPAPARPPAERQAPPAQRVDCAAAQVRHATRPAPLRPRRLDELPRGELYLSVMREVDGCQELVLASEERSRLGR
jgi:hypothetical protein